MSPAPKNWASFYRQAGHLLRDEDGVIREQGQARVCTTCHSVYYVHSVRTAVLHGVALRGPEVTECGSCYYQ